MKTRSYAGPAAAFLVPLLLGACSSTPPQAERPAPQRFVLPAAEKAPEPPKPVRKSFRQALGDRVTLDYEIETSLSRIDGRSCWSFVTGTLSNDSDRTLSSRSGLQFLFYRDGELLFRDLSFPRTNVPPGSRVQIELVQSPVHVKHCPSYDRIEVVMKKIVLATQ